MRIAMFYHSLRSDWNHGNAHFLRGVATELMHRGHRVDVFEPEDAWSAANLVRDEGTDALQSYREAYPRLTSHCYGGLPELTEALDGVDLVIVHEWNDPELVARIGRLRGKGARFRLLFHDTHHRSLTEPEAMGRYALDHYDGVLVFGEAIRRRYLEAGWTARAWTWHEAADTRVFRPIADVPNQGDLVWIGNLGDEERTAELDSFLFQPANELGLRTRVHGVRYPAEALHRLESLGISYGGWLANHRVPDVFAGYRATVHIPRSPYVEALPGIPTIRPFEALACGIPLVCSPWEDSENLFTPGKDYLVARDGRQMREHLRMLIHEPDAASEIAMHGHKTILERHTCAHRVDELLAICRDLGLRGAFRNQGESP